MNRNGNNDLLNYEIKSSTKKKIKKIYLRSQKKK